MSTLVYTWRKNAREEVRAALTEFRGHELADLRVYVVDEAGEGHPTQKGLSVRVDDLPKLLAAVQALIRAHDGRFAS